MGRGSSRPKAERHDPAIIRTDRRNVGGHWNLALAVMRHCPETAGPITEYNCSRSRGRA